MINWIVEKIFGVDPAVRRDRAIRGLEADLLHVSRSLFNDLRESLGDELYGVLPEESVLKECIILNYWILISVLQRAGAEHEILDRIHSARYERLKRGLLDRGWPDHLAEDAVVDLAEQYTQRYEEYSNAYKKSFESVSIQFQKNLNGGNLFLNGEVYFRISIFIGSFMKGYSDDVENILGLLK